MNPEKASILVRGLTRSFPSPAGPVHAIQDVDLSVGSGEFLCIVGPSGCGKTTLLRILAGLDTATTGDVTVSVTQKDRPVNSMVFQEQSVFPWMTVRDNVAYGLKLRGISKRERYEIARHYIDMIGLSKFSACYPHQLSGGMKQRVSVARAFANDPEILLMDEPFGALDEQNRILLQQELLRIWEGTRKTAVFITHSIDEALCLGDRIMVMTAHPGKIKCIVDNDLPRPRDISSIWGNPQYHKLFQKIWGVLQEEVLKVRQQEVSCSDQES